MVDCSIYKHQQHGGNEGKWRLDLNTGIQPFKLHVILQFSTPYSIYTFPPILCVIQTWKKLIQMDRVIFRVTVGLALALGLVCYYCMEAY